MNGKAIWAEIDLGAFRNNLHIIKDSLKENTKICVVVKANGYGHDAVEVAEFAQAEGADYFAVSRLEEALELRNNNINLPILVLGHTPKGAYEMAVINEVCMELSTLEEAKEINRLAGKIGKKALVHIKIDTGMSRLGFQVSEETADVINEISLMDNISIEGIFTHFATADCERSFALLQAKKYMQMLEMLERRNIDVGIRHIANSAGIEDFHEYNLDMVRCGIIFYGSQAYESDDLDERFPIKHPMTLKTIVTHIKVLEKGIGISYGLTYHTKEREKIASIAIGYADGFFRGQSNPSVVIGGKEYPIVGRICMDQCMVRVDMNDDIKVGDEVIVFGNGGKSVDQLAKECLTIPHEIMCGISRRVPRIIYDGDKFIKEKNYLKL